MLRRNAMEFPCAWVATFLRSTKWLGHFACEVSTADLTGQGLVSGKDTALGARFLAAPISCLFLFAVLLFGMATRAQGQQVDLDSVLIARASSLLSTQLVAQGLTADSVRMIWPSELKQVVGLDRKVQPCGAFLAVEQVHGELRMAGDAPSLGDSLSVSVSGLLFRQGDTHSRRLLASTEGPIFGPGVAALGSVYGNHELVAMNRIHSASFWRDVAEPILVVVGAAAIVALFFLVRS